MVADPFGSVESLLVWVVGFDLFYTVFLNTISLEITPFNLSVCVALAIGIGVGVADLVKKCERSVSVGVMRGVKVGCGVVPGMFLFLNFGYRIRVGITPPMNMPSTSSEPQKKDAILFIEGDNHFFPVTYGRLVERMREDVKVYDRLNLLFKMPYLGHEKGLFNGTWESFRSLLEKEIITGEDTVPSCTGFHPFGLSLPEQAIPIPYGLLHRVMEKEGSGAVYRLPGLWRYYSSESFYRRFEKDFMTRQVNAHFFLRYGIYLFYTGDSKSGLRSIREASHLGYDDAGVQCAAAIFFSDRGLFDLAGSISERHPLIAEFRCHSEQLGLPLLQKGRLQQRRGCFQESAAAEP